MTTMLQATDRESLRRRFEEARNHYEASRERFVARHAAGPAALPLRTHDPLRTYDTVIGRLQARLETLPTIEQAKGIIMARSGVSSDEAFDILRRASQRTNVKLRDLAADIVTRAGRPGGFPRPASPGSPRSGELARQGPASSGRPSE
jgi:hypothetical protein